MTWFQIALASIVAFHGASTARHAVVMSRFASRFDDLNATDKSVACRRAVMWAIVRFAIFAKVCALAGLLLWEA